MVILDVHLSVNNYFYVIFYCKKAHKSFLLLNLDELGFHIKYLLILKLKNIKILFHFFY